MDVMVVVWVLSVVPMDVVMMEPEVRVEVKGHSTTVVLMLRLAR